MKLISGKRALLDYELTWGIFKDNQKDVKVVRGTAGGMSELIKWQHSKIKTRFWSGRQERRNRSNQNFRKKKENRRESSKIKTEEKWEIVKESER